MRTYLYLSMTPESLVASQLPPEEFGAYMAVGTRKSAHGQVIFFDLLEGFQSDQFDLAYAAEHCLPHAEGKRRLDNERDLTWVTIQPEQSLYRETPCQTRSI